MKYIYSFIYKIIKFLLKYLIDFQSLYMKIVLKMAQSKIIDFYFSGLTKFQWFYNINNKFHDNCKIK